VIRTAWFALNVVIATPSLSLLVILASLVRAPHSVVDAIARFWVRWLLRAAGARVHAFGTDHIAPGRPQIIVANHVSYFDVPALASVLPKRFRFVAKRELTRIPLWGRAWQAAGHIAIDRSDKLKAVESLDLAGRLMREDRSCVVIFPEGTRSPNGRLQPFKKGAFMLAMHTGIEIVPVGIRGSDRILPKGSWRMRSGGIIVRIGRPITSAGQSEADREQLMALVRSEIEKLAAPTATDEGDVVDIQHPRA
jgi:1-acyl-sn-glycerol-3-phosphate acyltransferase